MNLHTPLPRLGIIGGGQLGKMLCQAASELGVKTTVLDPDPNAPASSVSSHHIVASFDDASAYDALVKHADVITYEREDLDEREDRLPPERLPPPPLLASARSGMVPSMSTIAINAR